MRETIDFSREGETHTFSPRESVHPTELNAAVIVRFVAANSGLYRLLGEKAGHLFSYGYLQHEDEPAEHVKLFRQWEIKTPDGIVYQSIEEGEHEVRPTPMPGIFSLELGIPHSAYSSSRLYLPD